MKNEENPTPGSVYRLVVKSADEAVETIRTRFGAEAKVLSVKQVEGQGVVGLFTRPKLEVVVQVGSAQPAPAPAMVGVPDNRTEAADTSSQELERAAAVAATAAAIGSNAPAAAVSAAEGRDQMARANVPSLAELLRRSGFAESLIGRMERLPSFRAAAERPLHVALVELGRDLRKMAAGRRAHPLPARTAFIGSCGVGRTTALCKWLGSEVFARGKTGRVLRVEFDQPNPADNLAIYCEALGLSLEHYSPGLDLAVEQGQFLYADLPGMIFRREHENNDLAAFLDAGQFKGRVLVLNALYDHATLRAAYAAGRNLGATHLVFTHCDELLHWGKLVEFLMDGELTPLFLATGPSLSGDCIEDVWDAVLRKTIPGA